MRSTHSSRYDGQAAPSAAVIGLTRDIENAEALDQAVRPLRPVANALVADPRRRQVLQGSWLGHAVHPMLTDVPIGFWMSANVLDLVGGKKSRPAASRLLALGILTAAPTGLTGLAEWAGAGRREQRVGVAHAAANTVAISLFTGSLAARRREHHARGVLLALAGSAATVASSYLGGHLTSVRKVSSRNPAFGT
jgi:uncharacterized membrane protein